MRVRRRIDGRIRFIALGVFSAVFLFSFLARSFKNSEESAEAASLANFDPGYIISDWQMGNYNSMSEAEIQAFLTAKGNCRDTRTYLTASYPHLSYHIRDGHFVCLAEEIFGEGASYGEGVSGGETAAHIIWQAAQDYKINPQVLIVLLQKEQGLITDSWPNNVQFQTATGYGCPDTEPCDAEYFGFRNQIRKAASLFRTVLDGGWTNYPLGWNYVQYNPNAGCGGTMVNIRNLATSSLYRYTPYQPNALALAAGYGTTDSCGAYGNRNFYLYFEDWFGGVIAERGMIDVDFGDDEYVIESAIDANKVIDINGGAEVAVNGTNIHLWEKNGTNAQKWKIIQNTNRTYTIVNPTTDKVLDVLNEWRTNGTNIQLWERHYSCAQQWYLDKEGDKYIFTSSCSSLVLDVSGGATANGTNIQLWEFNGSNAQKWTFRKIEKIVPVTPTPTPEPTPVSPEPTPTPVLPEIIPNEDDVEDGVYSLHPLMNMNKALDVENGSYANGANAQIYNFSNGNAAQEWKIEKNKVGNYYIIKNANSHKALDVANGVLNNNVNVWMYDENNSCAQRWLFEKQVDGFYIIRNACSATLVLDVQDLYKNIQIYTGWGDNNTAQKWKLNRLR